MQTPIPQKKLHPVTLSPFNTRIAFCYAILHALLAVVPQVIRIIGKQAACFPSCKPCAPRCATWLFAFRHYGDWRRQGFGLAVVLCRGAGGCREGSAYASAFSSFSNAVIHMASARSSASRSSAYFFCQMCSSSLRSS